MQYIEKGATRQRTLVDFDGHTFEVEGWYARGRRAKFYEKNGDPGYPAEPSELFDTTIRVKLKNEYSTDLSDLLSEDAVEKIVGLAIANMDDPDFDLIGSIPW